MPRQPLPRGAPPFAALRSAFVFEGALRGAVHQFKYRGKVARAAPLAALLGEFLRRDDGIPIGIPATQLALLAPVPLHPWRRWRRGYNQSALLAQELGRSLGLPHGEILRRTRHTPPQVGLSARARQENVKGAFVADRRALDKWNPSRGAVLLLDDVCTTGATLRECAKALKSAGVAEVYALTLARQL